MNPEGDERLESLVTPPPRDGAVGCLGRCKGSRDESVAGGGVRAGWSDFNDLNTGEWNCVKALVTVPCRPKRRAAASAPDRLRATKFNGMVSEELPLRGKRQYFPSPCSLYYMARRES